MVMQKMFNEIINNNISKYIDVETLEPEFKEIKDTIYKHYSKNKMQMVKLASNPDKIFEPFKENQEFMKKLENVTKKALHGAIDQYEQNNPIIEVNNLDQKYLELKNSIVNEYSKDIKDLSKLIKKAPELAQNPHKILEPFVENPDFMGKLENVTRTALKDKIPADNHNLINQKVTTENLKDLIKSKNPLDHIRQTEPDLFDMISQNNPDLVESYQTSQNDKSTTKVKPDDKSSLHILIGIIVIANIFTYSTFKFLNPTNRSQIELAILYVIIYVYTVLYSIAICYMSKWVVRLVEVGADIKLDAKIELIEKLIKNIFDLAIYTLPFHVLIGILSLAFQQHLMFSHKNDYLWSYQLFSCIISIIVAYVYNDQDISFDAHQIIRYYIIFVTVLSLIKMNINIDGASSINRFADGIVGFFLNVNLKKILIIMPLIMMILSAAMVTLNISYANSLKYICIGLLVCGIILATSFNLMNRYSKVNVDTEKRLKLPVLKAVSKWFIFMAVYLAPLYAYIAMTKGELVGNFTTELMKTFDINFLKILGVGTSALFILDKAFSAMDQKEMTRVSSLMILAAILLSKITKPQVQDMDR